MIWNRRLYPAQLADTGEVQEGDTPAERNIPYDYIAEFSLQGKPGNLLEDVINISVEGVFIAQEIGYGFLAQRIQTTTLQAYSSPLPEGGELAKATLGNLAPDVLVNGFRFDPALQRLVFPNGNLDPYFKVESAHSMKLLQRIQPVDELQFLFQIIDSGSGRELQNQPVHSIASLGSSDGERPFRVLAKPVAFLPRSTIRIQVEEVTLGTEAELSIALHGYKILGAADLAETRLRAMPALQRIPAFYGSEIATRRALLQVRQGRIPRQRLVPFDYVATFDLTGQPKNLLEDEVHINVEGGFVTTAFGYSLLPQNREDIPEVAISFEDGNPDPMDLSRIKLGQFPPSALRDGFRIHPDFVNLAFHNGQLQNLPRETINILFQRLNQPEDVRFKFRIIDSGTGRELQNKLELNIAGLGTAGGDRPFRELAYPLHFLPRSTIRVQVEEFFGRGRLFIVFQGYKILNAA